MEVLVALIIFILGCLQTHGITHTPCNKRRSDCCAGYMLRENEGRCVRCPVGYVGPLCQLPCPFPLYGLFCQIRCTCERSECNNIEGCFFKRTSTFVTPTSVGTKEEVSVHQNEDLGLRTSIFVSTVGNRVRQNQPPSSSDSRKKTEHGKNLIYGCHVRHLGRPWQKPCPLPLYGQFCQTRCKGDRKKCNSVEECYFKKSTGRCRLNFVPFA